MHAINGITKNIQYYLLRSYLIFIGIISNKKIHSLVSRFNLKWFAFTTITFTMEDHEDASTSSAVMENSAIFWQME